MRRESKDLTEKNPSEGVRRMMRAPRQHEVGISVLGVDRVLEVSSIHSDVQIEEIHFFPMPQGERDAGVLGIEMVVEG